MAPLAVDPGTEPEGDGGVVDPGVIKFVLPIAIAEADEATLAEADAILTLNGTVAIDGITGAFYLTLSKLPPVQV